MPQMIQVKVKPNARHEKLEEQDDGTWLAHIKAPPVDGKANKALMALLAKHFKCPKSALLIKSGSGARLKLVQISD